jgi:hypothetical protein
LTDERSERCAALLMRAAGGSSCSPIQGTAGRFASSSARSWANNGMVNNKVYAGGYRERASDSTSFAPFFTVRGCLVCSLSFLSFSPLPSWVSVINCGVVYANYMMRGGDLVPDPSVDQP